MPTFATLYLTDVKYMTSGGYHILNTIGVLAHLARARHWQCRGERFESAILHPRAGSDSSLNPLFIAPSP